MHKFAIIISAVTVGLCACTNTDNPQVAMCQAVAKQLSSNNISSWDNNSSTDNHRTVVVKVAFTNASGQAGTLNCTYPKHENGTVDTAPSRVVMNNQPVDQKVLMSAGTKASKELLAGTYKNTVAKSSELAGQAADKATDIAGKAKEVAIKGAKTMQELQQQQ